MKNTAQRKLSNRQRKESLYTLELKEKLISLIDRTLLDFDSLSERQINKELDERLILQTEITILKDMLLV